MRYRTLRYIQNMVVVIGVLTLLAIGVVLAQKSGYLLPSFNGSRLEDGLTKWTFPSLFEGTPRGTIGLISGHAGFDSGAICEDAQGNLLLTEAEINRVIAENTANLLQRQRLEVILLDEYDEQLQNFEATLLLSLHSDSCIDRSGYKGARHPNSPVASQEDALLACLEQNYALQTGLSYHGNTLTHDMFEYHAFTKVAPETPAVILEMGFMGGDQELLSTQPNLVARGITDSILCFLAQLESESSVIDDDQRRPESQVTD